MFPEIGGYLVGSPYEKDSSILGSELGSSCLRKLKFTHMLVCKPQAQIRSGLGIDLGTMKLVPRPPKGSKS